MEVFVADHHAMITAASQGDLDGIPKGLHLALEVG
jgi:hypothetical protein